jgi:hypothetical protein
MNISVECIQLTHGSLVAGSYENSNENSGANKSHGIPSPAE